MLFPSEPELPFTGPNPGRQIMSAKDILLLNRSAMAVVVESTDCRICTRALDFVTVSARKVSLCRRPRRR